MLTAPDGVITAAQGLRIAERGARARTQDRDLEVVAVASVETPDLPAQHALSLDGHVWRRLWSLPDRLVVEYVNQAIVEVRDRDGVVVFDRALSPDLEQHLLLDHVLPLILARRGAIVLHGAVITRGEGAAVLVGISGAGKSTLAAYAAQRGWRLGGDDGAVVTVGPTISVEPTYPTVRLTPEAVELLGLSSDTGAGVVGKRRLERAGQQPFRSEPAVLAVVAFVEPVPADRAAVFTLLRGAEAHSALFGDTFHADLGPGQLLRGVFEGLGRVVESVIVGRLAVPRGLAGLASAEQVLREVVAG